MALRDIRQSDIRREEWPDRLMSNILMSECLKLCRFKSPHERNEQRNSWI